MSRHEHDEHMPEALREWKPGNLADTTYANYARWREARAQWFGEHGRRLARLTEEFAKYNPDPRVVLPWDATTDADADSDDAR